jgi:phosphoglycolate phosphatase-like HAD superfamily hydrolase
VNDVLPVAFDVDGTVVDSFGGAMAAAADILGLFGSPVCITDRNAMRGFFGRAALAARFGEAGVSISLIHPLLMRIRGLAAPAPVFEGLKEVIEDVAHATGEPPTFFTAGYADSAGAALVAAGIRRARVSGREAGSKTEQLAQWAATRPGARYVCDTVTDVNRCRAVGVQAVGVAWGYDALPDLERAGALPVRTITDLRSVLLDPIAKKESHETDRT